MPFVLSNCLSEQQLTNSVRGRRVRGRNITDTSYLVPSWVWNTVMSRSHNRPIGRGQLWTPTRWHMLGFFQLEARGFTYLIQTEEQHLSCSWAGVVVPALGQLLHSKKKPAKWYCMYSFLGMQHFINVTSTKQVIKIVVMLLKSV